MNYGNLFSKAWDLIWEHKFLILLGVLVALGSAGGSGAGQGGASGVDGGQVFNGPVFDFNFQQPFQDVAVPFYALAGGLIVAGMIMVIGLALWVVSTVSRGGLIYGADTVAGGGESTFSASFRAGWDQIWRLIGIGLVPAIPAVLLGVVGLFSLGLYRRVEVISGRAVPEALPTMAGFLPNIALVCVLLLVFLLLTLLRSFANRACMLENQGVVASYRRGFEVLSSHLGPAIVLFILQVLLSLGIGVVLLLPGILIALCCFLWPILLLVQGTFAAFYSTLWTLAWNQWTGREDGTPEFTGA